MACPTICLVIIGVIIDSSFLYGFYFNNSSDGGSVAKAKAAKESIIKLTHNIYTVDNMDSSMMTAAMKEEKMATMFTVN